MMTCTALSDGASHEEKAQVRLSAQKPQAIDAQPRADCDLFGV